MDEEPNHRIALIKIVGEHALDFTSAVFGDLLALLWQIFEGSGIFGIPGTGVA